MKETIVLDKGTGNLSTATYLQPQRKPVDGDWVLIIDGKKQVRKQFFEQPEIESPIKITVTLSNNYCQVGELISYVITFSEPITIEGVVPISVTDRNDDHVLNIGCVVSNGKSTGSFSVDRSGDFTVTNKAINYHHKKIDRPLELKEQPWLRVYV